MLYKVSKSFTDSLDLGNSVFRKYALIMHERPELWRIFFVSGSYSFACMKFFLEIAKINIKHIFILQINIAVERNDNEIRTSSSAKQIDKKLYRRCYQIKKLFSITPEKNQREPEKKSKKIDSSLYEIVDDTPEDVTNLRKLRQRHIEEKRTIDFLLKRS